MDHQFGQFVFPFILDWRVKMIKDKDMLTVEDEDENSKLKIDLVQMFERKEGEEKEEKNSLTKSKSNKISKCNWYALYYHLFFVVVFNLHQVILMKIMK